ncbi:MAG: Fic family protein [Flavobacteriales bacterium]|nr:Fic family protein [Flavobacteriales bacterium]
MKYDAPGSEDEVLPNLLGLSDKRAIELEEAQGFFRAELVLYEELNDDTVFDLAYVMRSHRLALDHLYAFAGTLREVNISKGGFAFPAAKFLDASMRDFEARVLLKEPPVPASREALIAYLAIVHGELLFIHPFREGNGRTARLLADLIAMKHGYGKLDFTVMNKDFDGYVSAVQRAASGDYVPMERLIRAAFPN